MFEELRKFKDREGNCNVPGNDSDNPKLGQWVNNQRRHRSKISKERASKLDSIGSTRGTKPMNLYEFSMMYCVPHNTIAQSHKIGV